MKTLFLKPDNKLLKKVSQKISLEKDNLGKNKKIIQLMLKIAYGQQASKKKPIMVGLAAPQIGIFKRIILVDVKADGKGKVGDLRVYINPEITWKSKRKEEWYEGCYSTGLPAGRQGTICGIVKRSSSIKIKAFTSKSRGVATIPPPGWKIEKWTGYVARIFQHEIDHLDGKTFISHIKNPAHLHIVEEKEFPLYRNKEAWRNWPKKSPLPLA